MKWAALLVAMLLSTSANAQFVDGNRLLELCDQSPANVSGYVLGVVDWEITLGVSTGVDGDSHLRKRFLCVPTGVRASQIVDASCAYLRNNPQNRHWNASALVYNAVLAMYPCQ